MTDRPTLDTVAAAAGVSRMTVSNAYNRPDQLSAATRDRVLSVARDLGYPGPDPAGRSLRRGETGAVGVLLSEGLAYAFTDPGLVSFMRGVSTELGAAGKAMLMVPGEADLDGALVRGAIVDAFILCAMAEDDPAVAAVLARALPVVTAGSPQIHGAPFVGIDNRAAGGLIARHLLDLGHRQFGIVSRPSRDHLAHGSLRKAPRVGLRLRVEGFVRAVTEAGLDPSAVTVGIADENTAESGAAAARTLLSADGPSPTAIFAVTDVLALGVLTAARRAGHRVPRDLSVVGFDDIVDAAGSSPALTTVAQSLFEQGRQAARLALALMAGKQVRSPRIPAELVIRESTGRAPNRTGDLSGLTDSA
jgi:DNA-binding LacI/PurR family transcriptional regulator